MARRIIEAWRIDDDGHRPHRSRGALTPNEFAARPGQIDDQNGCCSDMGLEYWTGDRRWRA